MMMGRHAKKIFGFEPTSPTHQYLLEKPALDRAVNIEPIKKGCHKQKNGEQAVNRFDEANSRGNSFGVQSTYSKGRG
jgi:hypothetical protein